MYASRDGRTEIVTELLQAGADPEKRDVVSDKVYILFCSKLEIVAPIYPSCEKILG